MTKSEENLSEKTWILVYVVIDAGDIGVGYAVDRTGGSGVCGSSGETGSYGGGGLYA